MCAGALRLLARVGRVRVRSAALTRSAGRPIAVARRWWLVRVGTPARLQPLDRTPGGRGGGAAAGARGVGGGGERSIPVVLVVTDTVTEPWHAL